MKNPFELPSASQTARPALEQKPPATKIYEILEKIGVDPGIRNTVATLNMLGFATTESCEGHIDHGNPAPRVSIEAPNRPLWRFIGEQEAFEAAAQEAGVTVAMILEDMRPKYGEAVSQNEEDPRLFQALLRAREMTPRGEETSEFQSWRKQTNDLINQLQVWLKEFYARNLAAAHSETIKLTIDLRDEPEFSAYSYDLHNGGSEYLEMSDPEVLKQLDDSQRMELARQHQQYLEEMQAFTKLLNGKLPQSM